MPHVPYDDTIVLTAKKDRNFFVFEARERTIYFDLSDNLFKRPTKGGLKELKETGVKKFFRHINPRKIPQAFDIPAYRQLFDTLISNAKRRSRSNFGTLFPQIHNYMHLESFYLLDIKVAQDSYSRPKTAVSHYPKAVIRFMRESGFTINSAWEDSYNKNPKLVTDLCTYVMEKSHDDLLVYRHLYDIITDSECFSRVSALVGSITELQKYPHNNEYGFGAEYKAVFDYIIYCIAVEAMTAEDVITEYFDYLRMARDIKQLKAITKLREAGDTTTTKKDIGFPDYRKIEKYPKGLSVRHRIVTRNFNVMRQAYDDEKFATLADPNYAWKRGDYCIVTATKSDDIKNEGTELNHCVGSYIKSVLEGRTQIVFLRRKETPEVSLVTVEIRSRGIQQARGYSNRALGIEETQWLEKYAKAKNLSFGSVKSDEDKPCPTLTKKKDGVELEDVEFVDAISYFESEGGLCVG